MQVDVNTGTRQIGWPWLQQGEDTSNSPDSQIHSSLLSLIYCAPHPRRLRAKDRQGLPAS